MRWDSIVHLFLWLSLFQSSFSSTITVYRNAASSGGDQVENRGCFPRDCEKYGLFCVENCCRCGCPSSEPNYVVGKGLCKSNYEVNQELNAECKYNLPWSSGSARITDLPLTTEASGEKDFYNHPSELDVLCNHTIKVKTWENLNSFAEWQKGVGDIFSVGYYATQIGGIKNDYRLEKLKWSGTLHNQYAGTIIKINIACESQELGCVLAKVSGQKTYDTTNVQPPPTVVPPVQTTTETPPTTPVEQTTTPAKNESKIGRQNAGNSSNNTSNGVMVPVLATVGALLVIALIIAAIMIYRRRQKRNKAEDAKDDKDPIYDEVKKRFDNGVYNDPTLDDNNLRPNLGPLPTIPGNESPYQPLDLKTRNNEGYEVPIDGFPSGTDYDNLPASSTEKKDSSDYDNPPTQGTTQGDNNDYDNPPPVEGGDSEKPDNDVPLNHIKDSSSSKNSGYEAEDTAL